MPDYPAGYEPAGYRVADLPDHCTVEAAMEVLGGKWKLVILRLLLDEGTQRFGELAKAMPGVTARTLTRQLRELEADGLVTRTVHPQVPPKVEYSATEIAISLRDIVGRLDEWGRWYGRLMADRAVADRNV